MISPNSTTKKEPNSIHKSRTQDARGQTSEAKSTDKSNRSDSFNSPFNGNRPTSNTEHSALDFTRRHKLKILGPSFDSVFNGHRPTSNTEHSALDFTRRHKLKILDPGLPFMD